MNFWLKFGIGVVVVCAINYIIYLLAKKWFYQDSLDIMKHKDDAETWLPPDSSKEEYERYTQRRI